MKKQNVVLSEKAKNDIDDYIDFIYFYFDRLKITISNSQDNSNFKPRNLSR